MSWLSSAIDTATGQVDTEDLEYAEWDPVEWNSDWETSYNPATAQGYTGQGYNAAQAGFQTGDKFSGILEQALTKSGQFLDAGQQMLDPSSGFYRNAQGKLVRAAGQMAGQQQAQQSADLAARGIGGGGLRQLLGQQGLSTAMQNVGDQMANMYTQGAQMAGNIAGVGTNLMQQAGSMATSQEGNILQTALANQAATNQASQFGAEAQNVANQFTAGAMNDMAQFNAQQSLQNQQFNASNQMNFTTWNAAQDFAADQFNASQANEATMANAANTAAATNSVIGAISDINMKENIDQIGNLKTNGLPVYEFNYIFDSTKTKQIGLIAQDVEKIIPEAVTEVNGIKHVNYNEAVKEVS
tara:strand:+ start:2429 stop:3496 length:1068 start_codon:yes stop_codon:yes gene_type:complete